jgi:hypothetical protein
LFNNHAKDLVCSDVCSETQYCNVFVTLPDASKNSFLKNLCQEWKLALGYGIDEKIDLKRPVVCASHFADCDVIKYGEKGFTVSKTKLTKTTRNSARIVGNNSLDMPPIPSQTLLEVQNKKRHFIDSESKKDPPD